MCILELIVLKVLFRHGQSEILVLIGFQRPIGECGQPGGDGKANECKQQANWNEDAHCRPHADFFDYSKTSVKQLSN